MAEGKRGRPKKENAMSAAERQRSRRQRLKEQQTKAVQWFQFNEVRDENGMTEASYFMNAIISVHHALAVIYGANSRWRHEMKERGLDESELGLMHIREMGNNAIFATRSLKQIVDLLPFNPDYVGRINWDYPPMSYPPRSKTLHG